MAFANGKCIHGFEHGVTPPSIAGLDLFQAVTGSPEIIAAAARNGGFGLRISAAAAAETATLYYGQNSTSAPASTDRVVYSLYARYVTAKPTSTALMFSITSSTGSTAFVQYDLASDFFEVCVGTTFVSTGVTPVVGTWYRFDMIYKLDLDPRTFRVIITVDGATTAAADVTATGGAEAAGTGKWLRFGATVSETQIIDFDDVLGSGHAAAAGDGDFPITAAGNHHRVLSYFPDADGTHAVGSATFRYTDNNGGAFTNMTDGTTVSWSRVDEWPPKADADGADDWVEKSAGTTLADRVEWAMQPSAETLDPLGVHAHVGIRNDSGTTTNNCSLYLREGTTDAGTLIHTGTIGSATLIYRGMCYPLAPDGTAWDAASLNALKIRFSSSDIAPVPRVKAVMMEAAFQYSSAAASLIYSPRPMIRNI